MRNVAADSRFVQAGIFRRAAWESLLEEHIAGRMDHNYRLWMLFNLEVFWRHYIDGDSVADVETWIEEARGA
jgi:hypothetical protein